MARVIKEEERAVKRNEILDAAQQLVYTKGYELMSVQNVLEALQISKGAFYHYFGSKQALLDGMLERILEQVEQLLQPVIDDPDNPAPDGWSAASHGENMTITDPEALGQPHRYYRLESKP